MLVNVTVIFAVLFLVSCGGGGTSIPSASQPQPLTVPLPSGGMGDDWTTYSHDFMRTGYQAQPTGISSSNVASLKLRWTYKVAEGEVASPLVYNGVVYLASTGGMVRALDAKSGALLWEHSVGGPIAMTPTIADGLLFIGTHSAPAVFEALDIKTGALRWQTPLSGVVRSEPAVVNGLVFEGTAGGDPPACLQGGVDAFDEMTGAVRWSWNVAPTGDGGSVWAPISTDGSRLFFGTGNTCNSPFTTGNAQINLGLDGTLQWDASFGNSLADDDIGGGTLLSGNQAIFTSKNGYIYDLNATTGGINWQTRLTSVDGYGGIGTPTTDGKVIVASAGDLADPTHVPVPGGRLVGISSAGQILWSITTQYSISGYAAITSGIAFAGLDNALTAIDPASGNILWSYKASSDFYASPVIVPSGVYCVDTTGDVYAFSL